MNRIFYFGEKVDAYEVRVFNEREVRASAGILFLFAIISFLNSWLVGNFQMTKVFVVAFLVDFTIRIFVNPKYSPTLILGRFFVRHQEVEYVGAPQKRFAWGIGFTLAVTMFYMIVLNNIVGPFNLLVCLLCLTLLFFESVFGICIGCSIYNLFNKEKAQLCPGNVCAIEERVEIQKMSTVQSVIVAAFVVLVYFVSNAGWLNGNFMTHINAGNGEDACVVPDWAIEIGHEEEWKLHNNCE